MCNLYMGELDKNQRNVVNSLALGVFTLKSDV